MKSLLKLYRLKAKGFVRRIFSKPSSAILTSLGLIFFVGFYIMISMSTGSMEVKAPYPFFVLIFLGFGLFMSVVMLFQKRTALITSTDANFLLVGPFTKKMIIGYAVGGSMSGALLYCFLTSAYAICFFGPLFDIYVYDYPWIIIVGCALFYLQFIIIDLVYIRFMTSKHKWLYRVLAVVILLAAVASVFVYYLVTAFDTDFMTTLLGFLNSGLFEMTPIIGWAFMALTSLHEGDILMAILGLGLIVLVDAILTYITITTKDLDPEVIIEDAEWYEAFKAKTRSTGSNLNLNLKVKGVKNVKFKTGAGAISSRLFLEMRKTNSFITKQEFILIIVYLAIAYFSDYGFMWYSRYVSIILFVITISANYIDELKHHYIYLIPDKPINKLLAILRPSIVKIVIIILAMNIVGIVFGPTPEEFIASIIEMFGYGLVFITANILSTRLLKSNDNTVANQFIKMAVIIVALLPSVAIGILFTFLLTSIWYSYISSITSIIVACILLYFSKGIVAGTELNAD